MIYTSDPVVALNSSDRKYPVIGYANVVTLGNIAATTSNADFPVTNLANPAVFPPWKAAAVGSPLGTTYLTVTIGASGGTISYLAVASHNFGSIMATLSVETCANVSASPQVWTAHNFSGSPNVSPDDDSPIVFRILPSAYQGIRLKIVPGGAVQPQAGTLFSGELLVLERSVRIDTDHTPPPFGRVSKLVNDRSENGNFLGRVVQAQWITGQADFNYFTNAWYRANMKPFIDQSDVNPFFFAWSPVDYPEDVGYVQMSEDPRAVVDTVTGRVHLTFKYNGQAT